MTHLENYANISISLRKLSENKKHNLRFLYHFVRNIIILRNLRYVNKISKVGEKMFCYEKFKKLCDQKAVTPYQVSLATGVATSTLTMWKKGEYTPKADKILQIADYFGVPIDYFLEDTTTSVR